MLWCGERSPGASGSRRSRLGAAGVARVDGTPHSGVRRRRGLSASLRICQVSAAAGLYWKPLATPSAWPIRFKQDGADPAGRGRVSDRERLRVYHNRYLKFGGSRSVGVHKLLILKTRRDVRVV